MPSTLSPTPYWIKQIPRSLFLYDQVPLVGEIPEIPLQKWAENLKATLGFKQLEIKTETPKWTEPADFFNGIPNKKVFGLAIPGVNGVFFFALPASNIASVSALILTGDKNSAQKIDASTDEGFTGFLLNEILYALQRSGQNEKMQPVILDTLPAAPKEAALVINVQAIADDIQIPCRLLLTKEFVTSLAQEFAPKLTDLYLQAPLAEKIDLTLSLEVARFKMKVNEFKAVEPGDFLVLNNCRIDPVSKEGPLLLKIFDLPLFSGQLKDGKVTLAEIAKYYEAEANMQSEQPEKEEPEELEDFEELQEFSDEELEELDHIKTSPHENAVEEKKETPVQSSPAVQKSVEPPQKEETKTVPEDAYAAPKTAKELLSAGDIPLSLNVEVGRINISLKKLMELNPGNILEINSQKDSVDLILNGKRVATGELLKIGDVLGIRITDIGN